MSSLWTARAEQIATVPDGYGAFWGHAVTELDGSTTLHMYRPSCETFTGGIYKAWGRRHSG